MVPKSFFLFLLLVLPCVVFGNVGLSLKATLVSGEFRIENSNETYVVVFDAGSSGTRVHVFLFDDNLDLLQIDGNLEIYAKVSPGLSSYADNPEKAASSITPLLEEAVNAIPKNMRWQSPVQLGATAGLRLIGEEKSEKILEAVKKLFSNSSLLYEEELVAVISGTQEGTYIWVAMNYLLGHLGNEYSKTVGVIDLGGASAQMAYAVSTQAAANAPRTREEYITKHYLKGTDYYLYVHSYLRYGQDAARAQILKSTNDSVNYCILSGYNGGGAGQDKLYLASAFFYTAADDEIIDRKSGSVELTLGDFKTATIAACALKSPEEARTKYPKVWDLNLPFICLDLLYQYTLLTSGFGLSDKKEVTLINTVKYGDFNVDATWPLGSAIETVSGMSSTKQEVQNMYEFWSHA